MINMSMLYADYYAFTSGQIDFDNGLKDTYETQAYFFRKLPEKWGYLIATGLGDVLEYLRNLKITDEQIAWLKETCGGDLSDEYLEALRNYKFGGFLYAVPEGSVVFPNEPILVLKERAPFIQIPEAFILSCMNTQSVCATISARIKSVIGKRSLLEFGARRHPNPLWLARGAYIGGADATSFVEAGYRYGIPYTGTIPHKFIMERYHPDKSFNDSEKQAFDEQAKTYPHNFLTLVDTYNSISGVMNTIETARNHKITPKGIRLDSGDIYKLSHASRLLLNAAGLGSTKIYASGDMDEYTIQELIEQGVPIDGFGVGTRYAKVVLGGVYKLMEVGDMRIGDLVADTTPTFKVSDDEGKETMPKMKAIKRVFDANDKMKEDIVDKFVDMYGNLLKNYTPYIYQIRGITINSDPFEYDKKYVKQARENCINSLKTLSDGYKKISLVDAPPVYPIRYDQSLIDMKNLMHEKYEIEYKTIKEMSRAIDARRDEIIKTINDQLKEGLM